MRGESGSGTNRWIEATDPLGGKERVEYRVTELGELPAVEAAPPGMGVDNTRLNTANSYRWTKKAMQEIAPGAIDYAKAHILHWVQDPAWDENNELTPGMVRPILHSEKAPLESRVWYEYPGQGQAAGTVWEVGASGDPALNPQAQSGYPGRTGGGDDPVKVGRLLDDGSTQLQQSAYAWQGKTRLSIDAVGRQTLYDYEANGIDLKRVRQKRAGGYDTLVEYTYPGANFSGRPAKVTDAAGTETHYRYTAAGQPERVARKRADGQFEVTAYAYSANRLSSVTRSAVALASVEAAIPAASAATTFFAYDPAGNVNKVTSPEGDSVSTVLDGLDRPRLTVYPDGTYEQTLYDRLDPEWQRDRAGRWTHLTHNANRQVTAVTDPAGRTTGFERCPCGVLEAIVDAAGNRTGFSYDLQGRVTQKTYADNTSLFYTYGVTGRLLSSSDAMGQTTAYTYGVDSSLSSIAYNNAVVPTPGVSYAYDPTYRRVATMTDQFGETAYSYRPFGQNGAGRLWSENGPLAGDGDKITHTYDEFGRETGCAIGAAGSAVGETRAFDALGRVVGIVNALCPVVNSVPSAFSYHYAGNTGRLDWVDYPNGQRVRYGYHGEVAPAGSEPGNGDRRLASIVNLGVSGPGGTDGPVISRFDYAYDVTGNIVRWGQEASAQAAAPTGAGPGGNDPTPPIPGVPSQFYGFGYDRADQLESARLIAGAPAAPGALLKQLGYGYDAAGNRTGEAMDGNVNTASANNLNQLTARTGGGAMLFEGTVDEAAQVTVGGQPATIRPVTPGSPARRWQARAPVTLGANTIPVEARDASGNVTQKSIQVTVTGSAPQAFTYDANGNLLTQTDDAGGSRAYAWDAAKRLVKITYGASENGYSTEFLYNGAGQRVQEIENTQAASSLTYNLVWCGLELKGHFDNSGGLGHWFFVQGARFVPGANLPAASYYYLRDHLGSVRDLIDSTGKVRARYTYDPYGRREKLGGDLEALHGFTGHPLHARSGLHLAFFRTYDANFGKWLNRDPLPNRELSEGANLILYGTNNPSNSRDRLGLSAWDWLKEKIHSNGSLMK